MKNNNEHFFLEQKELIDMIMNNTFWIGVYPGMTKTNLEYMVKVIKDFCSGKTL